jgi:APA family basic amino acid/polyamine antiporter
VPILSVLACLYLMLNLSVETWLRFLAWLAIGLVIYFGYGRRHSRVAGRSAAQPVDQAAAERRLTYRGTDASNNSGARDRG